jgi:hypothetical protein
MKALLLLTLVANVAAFKFLANFKAASLIPRPSAMLKKRKAKLIYGDKKLAVITDASSSFGLQTAAELLRTEEYHVFGLSNDLEKMRAAAGAEFATSELKHFTPLQVELSSFESVNAFCNQLDKLKLNRPISRLICNAAVYQPEVAWSTDGHAETQQVNFLSHFQMVARTDARCFRAHQHRQPEVDGIAGPASPSKAAMPQTPPASIPSDCGTRGKRMGRPQTLAAWTPPHPRCREKTSSARLTCGGFRPLPTPHPTRSQARCPGQSRQC